MVGEPQCLVAGLPASPHHPDSQTVRALADSFFDSRPSREALSRGGGHCGDLHEKASQVLAGMAQKSIAGAAQGRTGARRGGGGWVVSSFIEPSTDLTGKECAGDLLLLEGGALGLSPLCSIPREPSVEKCLLFCGHRINPVPHRAQGGKWRRPQTPCDHVTLWLAPPEP